MEKSFIGSEFLNKKTNRVINHEVSYIHGINPSLPKNVVKTHFTYDVNTNTLTLIRDMSRFDVTPKEVPDSFMDRNFYFVDDNGKTIKTNYYTIRHVLHSYATCSRKGKSNKPFKKKVFTSFSIPGSLVGFSL